ncbi:MAG TPA: hypothetical protein VK281_05270 [Xanthobacteraceae bacterium]|nr:hypothetical protein [Xanthobacteraceae bacterium]
MQYWARGAGAALGSLLGMLGRADDATVRIATIPGDEGARPLDQGGCPLVFSPTSR